MHPRNALCVKDKCDVYRVTRLRGLEISEKLFTGCEAVLVLVWLWSNKVNLNHVLLIKSKQNIFNWPFSLRRLFHDSRCNVYNQHYKTLCCLKETLIDCSWAVFLFYGLFKLHFLHLYYLTTKHFSWDTTLVFKLMNLECVDIWDQRIFSVRFP